MWGRGYRMWGGVFEKMPSNGMLQRSRLLKLEILIWGIDPPWSWEPGTSKNHQKSMSKFGVRGGSLATSLPGGCLHWLAGGVYASA